MQRWINILAVVLGLQVLLAAGLLLRGDRLAPERADTPLVSADLKSADKLVIDGPVTPETTEGKATQTGRVELAKRDGAWVLPASFDAPADAKKVEAVLKQLTEARRGPAIATSAQAPDRFKVGEKEYERRVVASQGDKVLATVYLSAASGGRKANARESRDRAVYNIDMATYDLPTGSAEWFDHALLQRDASTVTRIELAEAGKPALTLSRPAPPAGKETQASDDGTNKSETKKEEAKKDPAKNEDSKKEDAAKAATPVWSAEGLSATERLDPAKVDELLQAIANLRVDSVLGKEPQADWPQEPRLRLSIADAKATNVTWTLIKPKSGDSHVLKSSDRPWYFELKNWDAKPLLDAAARDKLVVSAASAAPAKRN
jgi:hypothetical protein